MKQKVVNFIILHLFLFMNISCLPILNNQKHIMLKGCIDSKQLKTIPKFKIYFEGLQTESNDNGFFTIPLEKKQDDYSLLICKDFQPSFDSINTIKNLTLNTEKSYKFYSFQKATLQNVQEKIDNLHEKNTKLEDQIKPIKMRTKLIKRQMKRLKKQKKEKKISSLKERNKNLNIELQKINKSIASNKRKSKKLQKLLEQIQKDSKAGSSGDSWLITEKKFKKKKAIIPDSCVIACLNPKNVARVENWNFVLASNFVAFPRIILKNNLETKNVKRKQSITRASLKSKLASLDKKIFHEPKIEEHRIEENVHVALVK